MLSSMRPRWALFVGLGLLLAAAAAAAGENYAFLVAVGDYDRTELKPLKYTRPDVIDFRTALLASGYRDQNVILLHDDPDKPPKLRFVALSGQIRKELALLLGTLDKDDSVIVAFSGHGVQFEGEKDSYFCPHDARLAKRETLISFDAVLKEMDKCPASRKLLLVDACRKLPQTEIAKGRDEVNLESVTRPQVVPVPKSLMAFFSCGPGQESFEDPELGHGIFFHHLLKGWNGAADRDGDGKLEFSELESYVRRETKEYARTSLSVIQTPQLKGELSDEWILRRLKDKPLKPTTLGGTSPKSGPLIVGTKAGEEWDGNDLKMKFCWCPDGSFRMGSPPDEKDRAGDEAAVDVTLTGFWMGKHEVTQAEWKSVMGTSLAAQRDKAEKSRSPELYGEGPNYPMYYVNHDEATEFARRYTQQERAAGRLPAGWEYRLPTEAQWEYACRAGTTTRFASGDDDNGLEEYAWFGKNSNNSTHDVGTKRANAWGIHDMHGNVHEWCRDWGALVLPGGRDPEVSMKNAGRVLRGGCWFDEGGRCRSAGRSWVDPPYRIGSLGFRMAAVRLSQ